MAATVSNHTSLRFISRISVLLVIAMIGVLISSSTASAAPTPKRVQGYVYDAYGEKLSSDTVYWVIVKYSGGLPRASYSDDTADVDAKYRVDISPSDWDEGNTFEVYAIHNSVESVHNSTGVDLSARQWINTSYPTAIPQFGGMIGTLISFGLVGMVAVVALGFRTT